jgi:ABC-type sugar transport system substrate-binding protein
MKKILAMVLTLVMCVSLLSGCKSNTGNDAADDPGTKGANDKKTTDDADTEEEEVYQVACLFRIADMYAAWLKKAFEAEGNKYDNIEVTVFDTQDDSAVYLQLMENCILQGYDYIVAQTPVMDATDIVKKCRDNGIGYISINLDQENLYDLCTTVICNEYNLGSIIGELASKELPENANIVILNGIAGVSATTERRRGFEDALLKARTDVTLLDEQTADFEKDTAMTKMDDWLQLYGNTINGVLASSDSMALGAIESYNANGISTENVFFYGIDGLTDACMAILDGTMSGSALQDATEFAKISLDLVHKDIEGETDLINSFEPIVTFDPVLVTSENAQAQYDYYAEQGLVQ